MKSSHLDTPQKRRLAKALFKAAILFCTFAGIIIFARYFEVQGILDHSWADNHLKNQGWFGILLYVTLVSLLTTLVPRQAMSTLGGYAFGAEWGCLWVTVGHILNCFGTFFYARLLGRSTLQRRFDKRIQKFDAFLARNPFGMTVAVRCFPLGSNSLTNLIAGITRIPPLPFIAGSAIGYLPQNIIFSLLGSGLRVDPLWSTCVSALLFILSSAFGYFLYRRYSAVQDMIDDDADEQDPTDTYTTPS